MYTCQEDEPLHSSVTASYTACSQPENCSPAMSLPDTEMFSELLNMSSLNPELETVAAIRKKRTEVHIIDKFKY